jgi:hypothetical protein
MNLAEQSLSFDDLLNAVQESSRGRWFLGKYEERIRSFGTENILTSIAKLENAISSMSGSGTDAALVARAKSAIAAARKDIATLDNAQAAPTLSNEAHLFAKLAEMARASFTSEGKANDNAVINSGVVRALRLVDELDQAMTAAPIAGTNYFAPHAEVFAELPTPAAAPVSEKPATIAAVPAIEKLEVKKPAPISEVERGAKLTIKRSGDAPVISEPVVEQPKAMFEPATIEPVAITMPPTDIPFVAEADAPAPAEATVKPRVVIIRRKPEDIVEVPMVEDVAAPQEATSAA